MLYFSHSSICSTRREYKLSLIAKLPVQSSNQKITLLQFLFILISLFPRECTIPVLHFIFSKHFYNHASLLCPYPPKLLSSHSYRTTPPVSILHSLAPHSLLATHWLLCYRATFWGDQRRGKTQRAQNQTPAVLLPASWAQFHFLSTPYL